MFDQLSRRLFKGAGHVFAAISVCSTLVSCTPAKEAAIQPPDLWQTHLQPAKLNASFEPAVAERIYIPIYSHIYHEDNMQATLLTGTLSIRNVDSSHSLILRSVAYYDTKGQLLQELCTQPLLLGPMATAEIVVPRKNTQGGSGANFVIEWMAAAEVCEPIAEAVMISLGSAQDVSFLSRGTVISRNVAKKVREGRTPK